MNGYKLVDKDGMDMFSSNKYELNKSYHANGEIKYHKNGIHFCTKPEDTLRYAKKENGKSIDYTIYEIEASGIIDCGDDDESNEYYGYIGMYSASDVFLKRILEREELIMNVLKSNDSNRIIRLIQSIKLTNEEIDLILSKYNYSSINSYIEYYQYNDTNAFKRVLK